MKNPIIQLSLIALGAGIVLFVLIQLIPFGRDHTNPPVAQEPNWDSPQTRALAARACFDCHSNETTWPWYSNIAPISWLTERDVLEGRRRLNFSDISANGGRATREFARAIDGGSMPPFYYVWLHPSAGLSPAEKQALIQGLQATFGTSGEGVIPAPNP
jgi:hypothetical protein